MGVFQNNLMGAAAAAASAGGGGFYDYQIAQSVRLNKVADDNGGNFSKTFSGSPTNSKKGTFSTWIKRIEIDDSETNAIFVGGAGGGSLETDIKFDSGKFRFNAWSGSTLFDLTTSQFFRDPSAWYHLVVAWDTTQGTAADRVNMYVNGSKVTAFGTESYPSADATVALMAATENRIGMQSWNDNNVLGGYLAETYGIDGTMYAASDFGETKNGVWIPKDASGLTFGNNGFYLKYESSGDLGNDSSGNNNDWTANSMASHDQMLDSPTNNFCTFTPLTGGTSNIDFSEGNLKASTDDNIEGMICSFGLPLGGKYYWEMTQTGWAGSDGDDVNVGVNTLTQPDFQSNRGGNDTAYAYTCNSGQKVVLGSYSSYGASFRSDDVIGIAVDRVNHTINFSKDGSWQGTFSIPSTGDLYPWIGVGGGFNTSITIMNFGQDSSFAGTSGLNGSSANASDDNGIGDFYDTPPSGFLALCGSNLPIADAINPSETDDNYPQKLFTALAYSGDNGGSQTTGFQPDFVWVKARNTSQGHGLWDSSRGTTKVLNSDANNAEATSSGLTAFGSTGYTMGTYYNQSGNTYVSWSWRANGGSTSSGSGDLTSTHQVDPSGGFSIVKAVGDGGSGDKTVTHGLSAAPDCILSKNLDTSYNWDTYWSSGMTVTKGLRLNTNEGQQTGRWGTINSSIMTCKDNYTWAGTNNYIYYCFRNIEGYIKVGNYNGNGESSDGTFVYTGFKPAFVMGKGVVSGAAWWIQDDATSPYNPSPGVQEPNDSGAMYTSANPNVDFLSNGFKVRNNNAMFNSTSYDPYVFLAVAHNPFKYATAR